MTQNMNNKGLECLHYCPHEKKDITLYLKRSEYKTGQLAIMIYNSNNEFYANLTVCLESFKATGNLTFLSEDFNSLEFFERNELGVDTGMKIPQGFANFSQVIVPDDIINKIPELQ